MRLWTIAAYDGGREGWFWPHMWSFCESAAICHLLKGDIVPFSQSLSSLNIDKLALWTLLLIGDVGLKIRPSGSFDDLLLKALIEVSEYANKLLMFSLILWPQLSYLFPQMRDSLIENAECCSWATPSYQTWLASGQFLGLCLLLALPLSSLPGSLFFLF